MNDIILEETMSVEEFLEVIESVKFKTYPKVQVEKALKNTMYMVLFQILKTAFTVK